MKILMKGVIRVVHYCNCKALSLMSGRFGVGERVILKVACDCEILVSLFLSEKVNMV